VLDSGPLPQNDARFPAEIADGVWIIPDRRIMLVPNIAIILGRSAALVIDCELGLENGLRVLYLSLDFSPIDDTGCDALESDAND
jgi:hypothetical protein